MITRRTVEKEDILPTGLRKNRRQGPGEKVA